MNCACRSLSQKRGGSERCQECGQFIQWLSSLGTLAKSAVSAVGAVIKHGAQRVSDEEQSRRLALCEGCEFFVRAKGRCGKCGCHLKWKTALESWHCPVHRW